MQKKAAVCCTSCCRAKCKLTVTHAHKRNKLSNHTPSNSVLSITEPQGPKHIAFKHLKKKKTSHSLFTKANRYRGKKKKTEQHIAAEQKQYDRVKALLKQQDAPREKRKQKKKAKTIRAQSGNELEKKKLGVNAPQLPLRWKSQQRGRTRQ